MLTHYLNHPETYDIAGSFVIGDRLTDVELAKNLGCRAILLQNSREGLTEKGLEQVCVLATADWDKSPNFYLPENGLPRLSVRQKKQILKSV